MIRLALYTIIGGSAGALAFFLAAEGLSEGAVAGAILGVSLGVLVAMRRGAGDSTAAFEYETAGIHDDNLITTARRNLVREAYRQTFERSAHADLERRLGSARGRLLADAAPQSELDEQMRRLEYRRRTDDSRSWLAPQDRAQTHDLQAPATYPKRKRKPKRKRLG